MDIEPDPETVYQVLVAGAAVILFVASAVVVSVVFGTNGNLEPGGGVALVGTIGLFVLAMMAAGIWLERQEFPDGTSSEQDPSGPDASVSDHGQGQEH